VIVDNRGGGGGNPGMAIAARAQPDGYTLLLTSTAIAVNPAIYKNLPYDPLKDFASICEWSTRQTCCSCARIPASARLRI